MKRVYIFVLWCLFIVFPRTVWGQANSNGMSKDSVEVLDSADLADLKLPSLATLLEAADKNPQIALLKSQKSVLEIDKKAIKMDWLNQISLSGSYSYGIGTSMSNSPSTGGGSSTILNYSNELRSSYGIGVGVGTSIGYVLVGYRSKVKKQTELLKQSDLLIQQNIQSIKLQVLELYTTALNLLTFQKKNIELLYLANSALRIKTADYAMGMTDLIGLAAAITAQKEVQTEYETANALLTKLFYQLEILTGIKIANNNE